MKRLWFAASLLLVLPLVALRAVSGLLVIPGHSGRRMRSILVSFRWPDSRRATSLPRFVMTLS